MGLEMIVKEMLIPLRNITLYCPTRRTYTYLLGKHLKAIVMIELNQKGQKEDGRWGMEHERRGEHRRGRSKRRLHACMLCYELESSNIERR